MKLTVWAPSARSVELVTSAERLALRSVAECGEPAGAGEGVGHPGEPGAHWQIDVDESLLQDGYRYSIDGGDPVPDPRSRWQPQGVHGASHVVDWGPPREPNRPGWQTVPRTAALHDAVIYELHVGTFTPEGTYRAAQTKLDHLVHLGITHVELMPVATFPGRRGWGYDGVDLYAPFPAYGTPQELADFVRACHAKSLKVLLDVVYNHLGPDGNYLGSYGPYFTERYKTGWGAAVNFDGPHSDPVRRFFIDNAVMWLRDYGFDGLRLDAVHAIFSFEAVHFLEELAAEIRELGLRLGRDFVLIAESDLNDPRLVRPVSRGGLGLDAHWADDFHHALHRFFTGETAGYYADFRGLGDVATALRDGYVYQGRYSPHRGRRHGRRPTGVADSQLVVCAQNHDQVGNRAQGERLSMLLGLPQLKAIAALTLLSPFVPLLFQGEEWGARTPFLYFTDHQNAELGRRVAEGRAKEFGSFQWQGEVPNPQSEDTFLRSRLNWGELSQPEHAELFDWHRRLLQLRRRRQLFGRAAAGAPGAPGSPGRGRARLAVSVDEDAGWLRFVYGGIQAAFNFAGRPQRVPSARGDWELALSCGDAEGDTAAPVPGHGTRIYTDHALPR